MEKAVETLLQCESRLRELVNDALVTGDYDAVLQLTNWARHVAAIQHIPQLASNGNQIGALPVRFSAGLADRPNDQNGHRKDRKKKSRRRSRSQRKRDSKSLKYPTFARLNDELIKVGWSRKQKREYQHKAPRTVVDILSARLNEFEMTGGLLTTENIFPLREPDGTEVPSYQAYLVLAWFRSLGLLAQHGRQGYTITTAISKPLVDIEWAKLPSR